MYAVELERSLRQLRLGGMAAVLETRLRQAQAEAMAPIDLISCLVSDELTRRTDRLLERRRKQAAFRDPDTTLDNFDFGFNPKMNRSLVFDLATSTFIAKHEDALFLGPGDPATFCTSLLSWQSEKRKSSISQKLFTIGGPTMVPLDRIIKVSLRGATVDREQCIRTGVQLSKVERLGGKWRVHTEQGVLSANQLINCAPLYELFRYLQPPTNVQQAVDQLLYTSIYIVRMQVKRDRIGDHFALYIPDKDIIFHRLSKLNFLGPQYTASNGASTLLLEVTFRPGSYLASLPEGAIVEQVSRDLARLQLIDMEDITDVAVHKERYAYVIYDLDHRRKVDTILGYLKSLGISCVGRFAEFEYLNTDGVVERTLKLAREINRTPATATATA